MIQWFVLKNITNSEVKYSLFVCSVLKHVKHWCPLVLQWPVNSLGDIYFKKSIHPQSDESVSLPLAQIWCTYFKRRFNNFHLTFHGNPVSRLQPSRQRQDSVHATPKRLSVLVSSLSVNFKARAAKEHLNFSVQFSIFLWRVLSIPELYFYQHWSVWLCNKISVVRSECVVERKGESAGGCARGPTGVCWCSEQREGFAVKLSSCSKLRLQFAHE